jgi:hypothetical protein
LRQKGRQHEQQQAGLRKRCGDDRREERRHCPHRELARVHEHQCELGTGERERAIYESRRQRRRLGQVLGSWHRR